LRSRGVHIVDPGVGSLACNEEGAGRLADLSKIVEVSRRLLTPPTLKGKKVLISAGPTWEHFDPVRFISNPSSGKMGYALATVAARREAEVHLVSGPVSLNAPEGIHLSRVTTALDMQQSILEKAPYMDVIIMAAAVSDYRPSISAPQKVKKSTGDMVVALERNPDILAELGASKPESQRQVLVGFAAETENLLANAASKLSRKNLDFIVANDLTERGSGFGSETNRVLIIDRKGSLTELPQLTKECVAERIWDRVEKLMIDEP
jgi:phosphopantothenoylcysteine decarboxylase/phosphopantothenate--cysteine ligase